MLHGVEHKAEVVRDWLAAKGIPADRAGYLGNDLNDLGPMDQVAWPVAVADAQPAVGVPPGWCCPEPGVTGQSANSAS